MRQERHSVEQTKGPKEAAVEITLTIPEELAQRLRPVEKELPQILDLGIRAWSARGQSGFSGLNDVLETLASLPTPEEILALRPSPALQERIEELLEKNQQGGLSPEEQRDWEQYQYVEHLVRLAKARAAARVAQS
jgi:hypothetical protein